MERQRRHWFYDNVIHLHQSNRSSKQKQTTLLFCTLKILFYFLILKLQADWIAAASSALSRTESSHPSFKIKKCGDSNSTALSSLTHSPHLSMSTPLIDYLLRLLIARSTDRFDADPFMSRRVVEQNKTAAFPLIQNYVVRVNILFACLYIHR